MPSMLELQLRNKWPLWAALGAGCLVGASGMMLMHRLAARVEASRRQSLSKELISLHATLNELQEEMRQLKSRPLRSALRTPTVSFQAIDDSIQEDFRSSSYATALSTPGSTDYFSALSSDEEFLDLPTDNEATSGLPERADRLIAEMQKLQDEEREHLQFFMEVDRLMEGQAESQKRALQFLRNQAEKFTSNAEFHWRLCKATYLVAIVAGREGDANKKQEMIFEAVDLGRRALDCYDGSSESHKWYAIALGCRGEYSGIKEKILDGYEFKAHVDRASELAPNDHTIHHLLGRFCYEIAELSWWERKVAATLFADPPSATMEEARDHFLEAEKLKPEGWKENRHFLAKTCVHLKDYSAAVEWLEKANELPVVNTDDQRAQEDVQELMKACEAYR